MIKPAEKAVRDELRNIVRNGPVWTGDTLSHATVRACIQRGWVSTTQEGYIATQRGVTENDKPKPFVEQSILGTSGFTTTIEKKIDG